MTFGENLRAVRKRRHLSQRQLAEKLGTTHTIISRWESGIAEPGVGRLPLLCRVLDAQPNELLKDNGQLS